jgi:hypothetical protein
MGISITLSITLFLFLLYFHPFIPSLSTPTPRTHGSKHRPTNNKHPLFLPTYPLYNLIRALRQRRSTRMRRRYSIQFKQRRTPRERNRRCVCFVVHFESSGFIVHVGVEFVVEI